MKKRNHLFLLVALLLAGCSEVKPQSGSLSSDLSSAETSSALSSVSAEENPSSVISLHDDSSISSSVTKPAVQAHTLSLTPDDILTEESIYTKGISRNQQYKNEFDFAKNGSFIKSDSIKGITSISIKVFGTYDNLKMYAGTDEKGTLVTAVKETENKGKFSNVTYTYTFENATDAFYLVNPSEHHVSAYTLSITYNGKKEKYQLKEGEEKKTESVKPVVNAKNSFTVKPDNLFAEKSLYLKGVEENKDYPTEFNILKGGYIAANNIGNIVKVEVKVFGKYDNLKMYDGEDNNGKALEAVSVKEGSGRNVNVTYTYTFDGKGSSFYLENPSNYNVSPFYITVYYNGEKGDYQIKTEEGKVLLNGYSISAYPFIESSLITPSEEEAGAMIIKPKGYFKTKESLKGKITKAEISSFNSGMSMYFGKDNTKEKASVRYTAGTEINSYELPEGEIKDFYFVNETDKDIVLSYLNIYYDDLKTPVVEKGGEISIGEALKKGESLNRKKGLSQASYTLKGSVDSVTDDTFILKKGGESITCYQKDIGNTLHKKDEVTIEGKIQNYYGTVEMTDIKVTEKKEATYWVGIDEEMENGKVTSSLEKGKYGEEITLTAAPADGYKLKELTVNGTYTPVTENKATVKLTDDLEVSAVFVTADTKIERQMTATYAIKDYESGTQYASEDHKLDDNTSIHVEKCWFNAISSGKAKGELRVYQSKTNDGYFIINSAHKIKKVSLEVKAKKTDNASLYVSGSTDGKTFIEPQTKTIRKSLQTADFDFSSAAYTALKVNASEQMSVYKIVLTYVL